MSGSRLLLVTTFESRSLELPTDCLTVEAHGAVGGGVAQSKGVENDGKGPGWAERRPPGLLASETLQLCCVGPLSSVA